MASDTTERRRGGKFTFLLAFLAFLMSAVALYQQNRSTDFVQRLEARVASLSEKWSETISFDAIVDKIRETRDSVVEGMSGDNAAEALEDISDRLDAYLKYLRKDGGEVDETVERRIEQLSRRVEEAKSTVAEKGAEGRDEVESLLKDANALARELVDAK